MPRTHVLQFASEIGLEELQATIAEFVESQGCSACGLNGFDLGLAIDPRVNPAEFTERFQKVVRSVGFLEHGLAGEVGQAVELRSRMR